MQNILRAEKASKVKVRAQTCHVQNFKHSASRMPSKELSFWISPPCCYYSLSVPSWFSSLLYVALAVSSANSTQTGKNEKKTLTLVVIDHQAVNCVAGDVVPVDTVLVEYFD